MKENQKITQGRILKYDTGVNTAAREITDSAEA